MLDCKFVFLFKCLPSLSTGCFEKITDLAEYNSFSVSKVMSAEQLKEEKLAVQKALLQFENLHGRPVC